MHRLTTLPNGPPTPLLLLDRVWEVFVLLLFVDFVLLSAGMPKTDCGGVTNGLPAAPYKMRFIISDGSEI